MYRHSIAGTLIAAVAAVGMGLAVAPAGAQGAPPNPAAKNAVKRKPVVQAGNPARVTVRKRSYLDPGTETKTHAEHFLDYAFPPSNSPSGLDRFLNNYTITFTNSPLPSCLDLAGFCH
jgi:hypothetical protein